MTPRVCGRWLLVWLLIWLGSRHQTVIVRLALQETHDGPLATPFGVFPLPEAGERAARRHLGDRGRQDQDVDCYPEGTIIFSQLGVLANLQAALMPSRRRPGQRQGMNPARAFA